MKNIIYVLSLLACLGLSGCSSSTSTVSTPSTDTATYKLTFTSTWSATTHPTNFPSNPHFSKLIGVSHNSDAKLWRKDEIATAGIEEMAETGGVTKLSEEIDAMIASENAHKRSVGTNMAVSPGTATMTIEVHKDHPYISAVSMVAPSPDWFVGVNSKSMIEDGEWLDEVSVTICTYDAGSDSGSTYTSANADTNPKEAIRKLNESPFTVDRSLGTFVFKKQ